MANITILVVCRQNVGRSQMAEGFLKALTAHDPHIRVISAGIDAHSILNKYNQRPHPQVVEVMREEGIDISEQSINQITPEMLENATQIVVLTEKENLPDYFDTYLSKVVRIPIEDPEPGTTNEIQTLSMQKLKHTRNQIKQAMSHYVLGLSQKHKRARLLSSS